MSSTVILTLKIIAALLCSYLLGSFQPSYLLGKAIKHVDIRDYGSGNSGATNAIRVFGAKFGFTCLAIDAGKGALAIGLVKIFLGPSVLGPSLSTLLQLICGICVILGHNYPFYMNFRGGKGIAASLGIILVINWKVFLVAGIPSIAILLIFRIMSVASLSFEFLSFVMFAIFYFPYPNYIWITLAAAVYPVLAFYRHRNNLSRLVAGKEPRLWGKGSNRGKTPPEGSTPPDDGKPADADKPADDSASKKS